MYRLIKSTLKSLLLLSVAYLLAPANQICAQNFTDVTSTAGITFIHNGSNTDVLDFSSGAAWIDYNNDGLLDLYITRRLATNFLYRNDGNGSFTDVAFGLGVQDPTGDGGGVSIADFNNDGWQDIFLSNSNGNVLLKNNSGTSFTDITTSGGLILSATSRSPTASWGDYDNDGYLDLYFTHHLPTGGQNASNSTTQDYLFHNNRDETFTDVSSSLGLGFLTGHGSIGGWTDFDDDGDLDILLVNDCDANSSDPNATVPTRLLRNDGGGDPLDWNFVEISVLSGINDCRAGKGLAVGDYDRDGDQDYFYTNTSDCVLYGNNGNSSFTDSTSQAGLDAVGSIPSWGTSFWDYDNDGDLDISVAIGANSGINLGLSQPNLLYQNDGNGSFNEIGSTVNFDNGGKGRNIVYGDYDNDGDLDAFVINYGNTPALLQNNIINSNNYLKLDLVGTSSNQDGIGSKIKVSTPDGLFQYLETRSGSNLGGGDALNPHIGLGTNSTITELEITWPSGIVQLVNNVSVNQTLTVTETNTNSFTNVTFASGVNVIHDGLSIADMSVGTGGAWFDYNNDGNLDLYVTMRAGANKMYRNNGDGTFSEVAASLGIEDASNNGAGVCVADFNNDGWKDIYLANGEYDVLFKNNNGTSFTDISASSGVHASGASRGTSASWGDYDNDGYLDLFVSHHVPLDLNNPQSTNQDFLLRNNGDQTFTDVSVALGIDPHLLGYGFIGGWSDFDNDGDLDILLVNDCFFTPPGSSPLATPTKLFRNDGGSDPLNWNWTEVSVAMGIDDCRNGMGLGTGDFNRDGYMDYFYSNIGPVALFQNNGGTGFTEVSGTTGSGGQSLDYWSWGTSFWDYDNDGWQDMLVSMGAMSVLSSALPHPNLIFKNNQDGTFTEVGESLLLDNELRTRNMLQGDYDNDGDMDLFVMNYGQQCDLVRNDIANGHHYLKVKLTGVVSNRDGIGSRLKLTYGNGEIQYLETKSGSNLGGGDMIDVIFGIGTNTDIQALEIKWPSGIAQTILNPAADQLLEVTEAPTTDLTTNIKVLIQGAIDGGLMRDNLRQNGVIPAFEPFSALGFNHVYLGGGEQITDYANLMNVTGSDAIVDWIFVELRSQLDPTIVIATRSGLLQRDGDIVDMDGSSALKFSNLGSDEFYIVIRHRNHFGTRSSLKYLLEENNSVLIDFSDPTFQTFGTDGQINVGGSLALIAADANRDGAVNAVDKNLFWIPQNGQTYNYNSSSADFNCDGTVNAVDQNLYWIPNNSKIEQLD